MSDPTIEDCKLEELKSAFYNNAKRMQDEQVRQQRIAIQGTLKKKKDKQSNRKKNKQAKRSRKHNRKR